MELTGRRMDTPAEALGGVPEPSATLRSTPLTALDPVVDDTASPAGLRLHGLVQAAPELVAEVRDSGRPTGVTTCELRTAPETRRRALGAAVRSPAPSVWLTHRMLVVQWDEPAKEGTRRRTLLWCPSDHEATAGPAAGRRDPTWPLPAARLSRVRGTVLGHLRALGIAPDQVDLLAFDQLQGQDLRRLVGTRAAAPDLGAVDGPLPAWFPRATLLVDPHEWAAVAAPHPLQALWYRTTTFSDLRADRIAVVEGDVLLGPGVALVRTPGRTAGTRSLLLATDDGPWVISGNGVAADAWAPRASQLPGARRHAVAYGQEVLARSAAAAADARQYDAMALERALAGPLPDAPFPRCFPVDELTPHPLAPGLRPTHRLRRLEHGLVRGGPVTTSAGRP